MIKRKSSRSIPTNGRGPGHCARDSEKAHTEEILFKRRRSR